MKTSKFIVCVLLSITCFSSCHSPGTFAINSYPSGKHNLIVLLQLANSNPYIIGHADSFAFRIVDPKLNENGDKINALIQLLPTDRYIFRYVPEKSRHYKPIKGMQKPYDELHVYLNIQPPLTEDSITISNNDIFGFKSFNNMHSGRNAAAGAASIVTVSIVATVIIIGTVLAITSGILPTIFRD